MDFGGGFATGIGAGMGSGIAIGTASGQKLGSKKAKKQLREYILENGIEIQDRYGKPIKLDDFLEDAVTTSQDCCDGKKVWIFVLLAGALALGAAAYIMMNVMSGS